MKKITLCFFMMILPLLGFSQITEGFEGATFPPTTPGNWAVMNNGVGTGIDWAETTNAAFVHTGTKAAIIDRENIGAGNTSQDWLITPQVTLPANGQLRFWTRQTLTGNNGSTYEIRVSTNATQTNQAAFTTVATWSETSLNATFNVYEEKTVSLSAYPAGTQVYIAFVKINTQPSTATTGDRWIVDDVNLVQQCLDPSILTANVTGPTTATLGWTNNGSATLWDIYYNLQPDPTVPDVSTTPSFNDVNTTSYPATGFSPGTAYKFWVRAQCAGGVVSNWVGPFNFITRPAGSICSSPIFINSLPYSHTANTSTYGDEVDTLQGAGCAGGTTNYMQGPEVFYSYTPTVSGNITVSMTPTGVSSSLYVYNGCANVGVSCLAGVADATANPRNIATLPVIAGQTYIFVISSSTTPTGGIPYTLIIQEKFCDPPTNGTTNTPATTSINMSWTGPVGATSWQVTVQAPGAGVPTGPGPLSATAGTNTNFNFTGLAPATSYEYWVRADCGGGLFSPWAGPYLFNTAICDPVDRCNYTFRTRDSFGDGWNGNTMSVRQNGVTVATIVGPLDADNLNPIDFIIPLCENYPFELFWNSGGTFATEVGVSVINNFGQTIYDKPFNTGSQNTLLFSSSFDCQTPACLVPLTLNDTTPTTYGATLTWGANGGTNWDIYIVPTGSPAPTATSTPTVTGVTSTTYVIPASLGLLPNTVYQYYIRTVCSPTQQSPWAGPGDFTTLPTCSRPTGPGSSNITASSATLTWTQPINPDGLSTASQWQIILLPCGSPAPTAATTGWITVNTNNYSILGLTPLTCYDFYVRAICSPTDASPISVVHTFNTPDTNDECVNSKLVPVNQNTHCIQTVFGTVAGATASPQANTCGATADNDDVWFHFVATATTHYISLLEPVTSTANPPAFPTAAPGGLNYSLYRGSNCGSLVQVSCRTANGGMETGLVIGETYKIRVYSPGTAASTKRFEVCVGTKVIYCENSVPVCAVNAVILRNDVGVPANPNPISGTTTTTVGCLGSAPSPTFYFLTIQQDGNYNYFMEQSTDPTFATVDLDVDYVTWGPFTSVTQACSSISVSNTRPAPQGCSFSAAATENFTLTGALTGQVYIMMITNYTASSSYPGKRGYIRITRTVGPAPLECCPFANFTYSSSFFCKDGANPSPILGTASTGGTYTASSPNLVINPTTGVIDLAASTVGTYTVTSTIPGDTDCPTSTATFSVTISNPPSATIAYGSASYCKNNTVAQPAIITGTAGGFYSTSPATGLSVNPTTGAITPSTSTPGLYTVIYTIPAGSGCPAFVTQTQVTIDALPVATFNYGTAPYCSNGGFATPVFTGGGVAGMFTSTSGLVIDPSTGVIDLAASTAGTYTVTNEIAANGACPIVQATASITINALPIATFNYLTVDHCQNEGIILPTFIGGGVAGTFSSSTGLVINATTGEIDLATSTPGTYTVYNTVGAANGCPQVQEQFIITVNANPIATISSSDLDNTICAGQSATLTVNPTNFAIGDATYVWLLNTNPLPGATSYQYNPTVTGLYEVQITLNGCTNVAPITTNFTVNFVPQATIDGTNLVKCVNEVSVITVTPVNYTTTDPVTYSWTLDGGSLPDTTSSISYDDYGTYEVTIMNQGCSTTLSIIVSPDTTEIPIDAVGDCQGSSYILTASPINGSFDPANVTYEWMNSNGNVIVSGPNLNTFNVSQYVQTNNISSSSFPLTFTVKVTTSPDGCTDTQDFVVVSSNCTIPKGISPNGDGKNDSFDLRGLGVKQLNIFNRYGTKVYSYSNYTDQWHGQTNKGDELPVGTYYFVYELNDGQNNSGWIYINK